MEAKHIAYTGIVLDDKSAKLLLNLYPVPEGWTPYAHHCTLALGKSKNPYLIGRKVSMVAVEIGRSESALAVRVKPPKLVYDAGDFVNGKRMPHITIAVAPGCKPFLSNQITEWEKIDSFSVQGTALEVERSLPPKK